MLGDPLEDRRRVERRRDLATDVGKGGHLRGPPMASRGKPGVLDRDADVRRDRRQEPHVGLAEAALLARALDADHADRLVADDDRHAEPGQRRCPDRRHREPVELGRPVEQQRLSRRQDARRQAAAHRHRLLRFADAVLDVIRERDDVVGLVLEGDEGDVGRERLAHLLADQLDQRREVELRGDRLADAVDRVELGDTLAGLVDQPRVLERDAEAGRERRQQPDVARP